MANDLNRSIKIFIDNSDAMANAQKLENKISSLRAELQKLSAEGKRDTKEYMSQEKALNKLERSYGNYKNKISETERVLKNLSGSTYKELTSTKKMLQRELQNETRGTVQYTAKLKSYNSVQKQITIAQREMNGTLGSQGTIMSRAAAGFNKYFAMATAGLAAVTGISFTLRKLSQDAAEMEDVYADVMKTTGMTREEVGDLNEEFKQMDTRTSREQLNALARDAGKLGLSSRQDILDFVDAANQIQVALGEDLGDGAIRDIGKMADVFSRSTKEFDGLGLKEKMLAVGSAINEIGASSSANEDYLVQFAGRLGGVATQAGLGIDQVIGFASALDQDMQQVEMSATALQQFIIKLMGEPAKFAEIAGLEVKSFTDLLKTDANSAIKTVLRALNEKGGFQQLIPYFDEMGLSGTRAVGVLSAMAGSIDKIDDAQKVANTSMVEAVSLTTEYNIKNRNAAAELEKRKKAFKDAAEELGTRLNPALLKSTNIVTYMVKWLPSLLDFLMRYGRYIFYLATAYAAYTAAVKISTVWETRNKVAFSLSNIALKVKIALLDAAKVATLAYNVVTALLTGNITRMRAAWKLLNAAMATNPIGLIAVAATAAVAGVVKLVQWINRASDATKSIKDATKQYNSELASEKREVKALFEALKKSNPESATHLQIRKEIISKYGQYLQGLVDEKGNITNVGEAINAVNNGLREQIALKIKNQAADQIITDSLNEQSDITDKVMKRIGKQVSSEVVRSSIRETINRTISEFTSSGGTDYAALQSTLLSEIQQTYGVDAYKGVFNVKNIVSDLVKEVKSSSEAISEVDQKFAGMISKYTDVSAVITPDPVTDGNPPGSNPTDTAKQKYDKQVAALESYIAREKAIIQQKYVDGLISQQEYNRQLVYLEQEHLRKNLELAGITYEQRQEIELKIFDAKKKILDEIENAEKQHQDRLLAIQAAADQARAEKNWNALKTIAAQNLENDNEARKRIYEQKKYLMDVGIGIASEMGTLLGGAITKNKNMVASSIESIVMMGLDALKAQVQISLAGVTAQGLAASTLDPTAMARAALIIAGIEAAFSIAKGAVSSIIGKITGQSTTNADEAVTGSHVVTQRAAGKYDVIGADDRRLYRNVPYAGHAQTGYVSTPTLMGEQGRELVISAPDLVRLQRHINYPLIIQAINDARGGTVPQRASGNYTPVNNYTPASSQDDAEIYNRILKLLDHLINNGVQAPVVLSELQRKQYIQAASQKIGKK